VSGSLASGSAVTVVSGATLSGTGTVAGTVGINGILAPGASVESLDTGTETWNEGGSYTWEINNATGTAGGGGTGDGWDFVNITGDLSIQASSTLPFTINVVSLSGTAPGSTANFNCQTSYRWHIATVSGSVQNFSASKFSVNASQFQNFTGGGTFTVQQVGQSVDLVFTPRACVSGDITAGWNTEGGTINITIQNAYGLGSVVGLRFVNCTMTAKAYASGDTLLEDLGTLTQDNSKTLPVGTVKVVAVGTRTTAGLRASCNARAYDLCNAYSGTIDPVTTWLAITGNEQTIQVFTNIPSAERYVSLRNGTPGLNQLAILVNGQRHILSPLSDGESRSLDIGGSMSPGDENVVVLVGEGPVGASSIITIADAPTGEPMAFSAPSTLRLEARMTNRGLQLSWPEAGAGYVLQSRPIAAPQSTWSNWPAAPEWNNGRFSLTVPTDATERFFRLCKP